MSRNWPLVLILLGSLVAPASAYAQLTPPAGSAGAGNPSVLSDPSGIGNASRIPPVGTNSPPPPVVYGPIVSSPSRVVAPYAGASQRITSPYRVESRKPPVRRRGRPQLSSFTGICRGC